MVFAESATRLAASLIAILHTRAQLVATEVEEESLRYFSYLMLSLCALFCAGVALVLAVMLFVVLYWDTHRIGALSALVVVFGAAAALLGLRLRSLYRVKPKLLVHSMNELSRDAELLQPRI